MTTFLMAVAGGLGALARVEVGTWFRGRGQGAWATRSVNLVGALALALLVASDSSGEFVRIVGVGLLGGFTTFSTWMVEAEAQRGVARAVEVLLPLSAGLAIVAAVRALA